MSTSVFDCMTQAERDDVNSGAMSLDVSHALQRAVDLNPSVYLPTGSYRLDRPILMMPWTVIEGEHPRTVRVVASHSGTIFLYPTGNLQCALTGMTVHGRLSTAVSVLKSPGNHLDGYLNQFRMSGCNIGGDMAFGIDAPMLCCSISDSTFGYTVKGPAAGLRAIRSIALGSSAPNLNSFDRLVFNSCGDTLNPAVELFGGAGAAFRNCDWEGCTRVLRADSMARVSLNDCWLERNAGPGWLVYAGASYTPMEFVRCHFADNNSSSAIECEDGSGATIGVRNCFFGLADDRLFPLWLNGAKTHAPAPGVVDWENNHVVSGGVVRNDLGSGVRKMGVHLTKGWARVSLSAENIDCMSEPSGYLVKNGIGDVTLTVGTPFCSNKFTSCIVSNAADADDIVTRCWAVNENTIRITARKGGQPHDCVVSLQWSGK
jgi:hypothetical protein